MASPVQAHVRTGTEHITINRFEERRDLFLRNGNAGLVNACAIQPRDIVALLRDETVQTGNHMQGLRVVVLQCLRWVT